MLSQESFQALSHLSRLNEESFNTVIDLALGVIVGRKSETDFLTEKRISGINATLRKALLSSLISFFFQIAKDDTGSSSISQLLKGADMEKKKVDRLIKAYIPQKANIRRMLMESTFSLDKFVDVKWRLDHVIQVNSYEKVKQPLYHINIVVDECTTRYSKEEEAKFVPMSFFATLQDLQDISIVLKDALKQIDRALEKE